MPAKNHLNSEQVKKLQQALKQEENGAIRERILILLLLNDGKTQKEIAKFIGCSSNKIGCISLLRMCHKRVKIKKLVKSSNENEVNNMTPSDQQQLKAHLKAAAEIIYRNTAPTELKSFETIEKLVRQKMLEEVGPELGSFFFQQYQELKQENPEK